MPQHNGKKDRFDEAFNKRFNIEPQPAFGTDNRFDQAFNLRFEQRQAESQLTEFGTPAGDVPLLSQDAEDFFTQEETPLTPDQEFGEIISPEPPQK